MRQRTSRETESACSRETIFWCNIVPQTNSTKVALGKYRHYKGGEYEVMGVGCNESDLQEVVIYRSLYDAPDFPKGSLWVRLKESFLEKVVVDGVERPRFEFIG